MEDGQKNTQEAEKPFEEAIIEAKDEVVEEFYKDALLKAGEFIKALQQQNAELHEQQLVLRDEVALQCYSVLIRENSDYKQAAGDAYTAADAFIRVRETGVDVQLEN